MYGMGLILKPIDVHSWVEPPGDQGMLTDGGSDDCYAFLRKSSKYSRYFFAFLLGVFFLTQMKFDNMTTKQQANIELFFFSKSTIKM